MLIVQRMTLHPSFSGRLWLRLRSSRRPLEAYTFYSITRNDEKAIKIRRTPGLEKVLYEWLGWKTNALGESLLTAAVLSNKFETIKAMFDLKSKRLAKSVIHNRWVPSSFHSTRTEKSRTKFVDHLYCLLILFPS